jgi:single-strand DNA-binding protein
MSKSLNKIQLIGNVGKDPEVRSTQSGARVAEFSLATSEQWNDQSGAKQERTQWHRCIAWNKSGGGGLADVVEKYVTKGSRLYIEGAVEYRSWQDQNGQTRYTTEIRVRDVILLSSRNDGGGGARASLAEKAAGIAGDFEDFPGAFDEDGGGLAF